MANRPRVESPLPWFQRSRPIEHPDGDHTDHPDLETRRQIPHPRGPAPASRPRERAMAHAVVSCRPC